MVQLTSLKKAEIAGGVDSLLEKLHGLLSGNDVMHIWGILTDVKGYSGKGGKRIAKRMKELDDFYNEVYFCGTSENEPDIEKCKVPLNDEELRSLKGEEDVG